MSRIDEALRIAAKSQGMPEDGFAGGAQPRASVPEASILDRYMAEQSAKRQDSFHYLPTIAPDASQADSARPIAIPPALEGKLVVGRDISPLTVEQYRRLAAALHDLQAQHGLKILMVTSATPQEGKSLTIANLALTLSESYHQRVLLVDADLRRPSMHEVFGIPNRAGLADMLTAGGGSIPAVGISKCLSVLTAGRPLSAPLAMLTSERTRAVIRDAAARFDWLLLDTPPVGLLPDAQLISRLSEGILFVIGAGVTPYPLVQRAIADLGAEHIVGTVLNRVEQRMLAVNDVYGGYYGKPMGNGAGQR